MSTDLDSFFKSDYTYDDAVLLAEYWGQSVGDAKARIGRKVGWGDQKVVDGALDEARAWNTWTKSGYSYDDAVLLSEFWGGTAADTKLKIGRKIGWGNQKIVDQALADAGSWNAWVKSPYTYDDASLLASYWSISIDESKLRIGRKFGGGESKVVDEAIEIEHFGKSGYTYDDAELLVQFWGGDAWANKLKIGRNIRGGKVDYVEQEVTQAREWQTYSKSQYSFSDAEALAEYWGQSTWDAKLTIGRKIGWGNNKIIDDALLEATGGVCAE